MFQSNKIIMTKKKLSGSRSLLVERLTIMILFTLLFVVAQLQLATGAATSTVCPTSCGDVSIPYPFNLGVEGCPGLPQYRLECKHRVFEAGVASYSAVLLLSSNSSTHFQVHIARQNSVKPGMRGTTENVLSIQEDSLIVNATGIRASCCNCTTTATLTLNAAQPYAFSGENKFFVNGCNSRGFFSSDKSTGMKCETGCDNPDPITDNYCNGFGCCSSPVPSGSREITFSGGGAAQEDKSTRDFCGFSSIIYPESYRMDVHALGRGQYGIKLQWAIQGATSCEEAKRSPDYACSSAASCKYSNSVPGYTCVCHKSGYTGDGYKLGTGCSDLNECKDSELNNCDKNADCTNIDGGHECKCKNLYVGDGFAAGTGCSYVGYQFTASLVANSNSTRRAITTCRGTKADCEHAEKKEKKRVAMIIGIVSTSVLVLVLLGKFIQWVYKLWNSHRYRPKDFYSANLSKLQSLSRETAHLFTYKELSKAANGFSSDLEIGTGGYGTVFKGTLPGGSLVAIKKTNHVTENGVEQFLNEVTILSQVNHRNLVKLMGCCLETEVPMLVYEYIPNGTLYDHLQALKTKHLNWDQRLKISIETAEALTYLHSAAFPPIYHRDVKSTNILLDWDLTVKVTDFGLSRLVPKDVTHVSTVVMGTPGYMDPEYYHSYQLTDKSDVYSFGVVLMELITSLKPVDFTRSSQQINLAAMSLVAIKSGRLMEILDPMLTKFPPQTRVLKAIQSVGLLAVACLAPHREQRPSMREVVDHLVKIKEDYNESKNLSEPVGNIAEEESIKHKEYSDHAGILGAGGTGAFIWDSLVGLGSVDGLLNVDLIDLDLEGR